MGKAMASGRRSAALPALALALWLTAAGAAEVPEPGDAYRSGLEAYRAGDGPAALERWRPAAEAGDPWAQSGLGLLHESGTGVPRPGNRPCSGTSAPPSRTSPRP
ncbi:MAG: hypothetical protein U5L11_00705 [Arhodomonas sp.]|nr:hypothetical protein [Arhodomonas sp.]